jgi:hypothetical protein
VEGSPSAGLVSMGTSCIGKVRTNSMAVCPAGVCEVVLGILECVAALGGEVCSNLVGSAELLNVTQGALLVQTGENACICKGMVSNEFLPREIWRRIRNPMTETTVVKTVDL